VQTLITGGTGFLGAQTARCLVEKGESPILFDINDRKTLLKGIEEKVKIVKGNLANLSHVLNVIKNNRIDIIYHLGGMLSMPSEADPWASYQSNANGTFHVLEASRILGVKRIIFSSTTATFGIDIKDEYLNDYTLQRPALFYGCTKVFAELLGRFYRRKFDLDFRAARFPSVVGPGVKTPGVAQYTSWAIEESYKGNPFAIWVTPETRCPIIYYKDAALSLIKLAEAPAKNIKTVVYTLGGVFPTPSAKELSKMVKKKIPSANITFEIDKERTELITKHPIDDRLAREEWGWNCTYNLNRLVDDFIHELTLSPEIYN
jgi:nucleoside-diphosphate-sugar epimerase